MANITNFCWEASDKFQGVIRYKIKLCLSGYLIKWFLKWKLKKCKCFCRRCGQVSSETYHTTISGNPNMMLLKFDSAFASSATAGKGFNLTVKSAYQGK